MAILALARSRLRHDSTDSAAGKRFGPKILFEDLNWLITPKERVGIVGANGTGKSTLLKVLAGIEGLDYGSINVMKGIRAGYLPQDGITLTGRTVFDECLAVFAEIHALEAEQQDLAHRMSELDHATPEYQQIAERYHHVQSEFTARDGYNIESRVGAVLSGLGFRREDWPRRVEEFSGGWQMRIALAKLLLEEPNLLLLDEPTNHLDLEARNWLESYLETYPNAFVLISHDRFFLDVTVSRIAEIWNKRVWFYTGGYSKYEQQKTERRAQLEAAYANQRDRIEQLEAFINRFRAQATKAKQVQSRIKELEKIERIEIPPDEKTIHFRFPQPKPSGRIVAEFRNVAKSYGEKHVFSGASFNIERGDRIALVGINGAGKSTLIKLLSGEEPVTAGEYMLGHNVTADYFAQDQYKALDTESTILDDLGQRRPAVQQHRTAQHPRMLSFFGRRRVQADRRPFRRRAQPLRAGAHADDAGEFSAARRAHQPPRHARQRRAAHRAAGVQRHRGVRFARPLFHRQTGHARDRSGRWRASTCSRAITKIICGGRMAASAVPQARSPPKRAGRRAPRTRPNRKQPLPRSRRGSAEKDDKQRRLNPIKLRQMKDRQRSIEDEITRLEVEIADFEQALSSYQSAEMSVEIAGPAGVAPRGHEKSARRVGRSLHDS